MILLLVIHGVKLIIKKVAVSLVKSFFKYKIINSQRY